MALEGLQLSQYRLIRLLGSGGMGEVYLAEDARINQQVAIKVARAESSSYPNSETAKDAIRLFQREAKAIARLDHPRILPLFGYGEENVNSMTLTYIIMPYRREGSFADWLQQRNESQLLPAQDVAYFIEQAADALQYAHDNQIIHQDVKPSNFLIRTNKQKPHLPDLLLADFGIARLSSATSSTSHSIRGTPTYMAPEQWSGEPVPATDQYALAILAYELLAGRPPFKGRQEQVMYQHLMVQPQPPSTLNPRLSSEVDAVILKALQKKPEDRFSSIYAFAQALEEETQRDEAPPRIEMRPSIKAPDRPRGDDLQATLAISQVEARNGTSRTLTLPGGKKVTVSIPAGAYEGQVIRVAGQGETSPNGNTINTLVLRLTIQRSEESGPITSREDNTKTVSSSNPGFIAPSMPISNPNPFNTPAPLTPAPRSNMPQQPMPIIRSTSRGNRHITARSKSHRARAITLIILVVLLVLSGVIGLAIYNNYTNQPNPYPPNTGTLVLNDSLSSNGSSGWDANASCQFANGAYHVTADQTYPFSSCIYSANFSNFAFEVQMTIIQGDCGGIAFKGNYFTVCDNSTYHFNSLYTEIPTQTTHLIKSGLNQSNTIVVVIDGNNIDLYVNQKKVGSSQGNNSNQGQIGLIADTVSSNSTDIAYNNAKLWTF